MWALPKDDINRKAVIKEIFYKEFPGLKPKLQKPKDRDEIDELVVNFYNRDDVSQQLPGEKDSVRIREKNGTITQMHKRILLFKIQSPSLLLSFGQVT
jgi:hypothetical protein